jgi:hypothetical protein
MRVLYPTLFDLKQRARKHPLFMQSLVDYGAILIEK